MLLKARFKGGVAFHMRLCLALYKDMQLVFQVAKETYFK